MTRSLLDVNVLLALLDRDHVDHAQATSWLAAEAGSGWASCALTQNGFVRILSQPRYPSPVSPTRAAALLRTAAAGSDHQFWPCHVSVLDTSTVDLTRVHGAKQVTDAYLLALAVAGGGRFVTFDRSIVLASAPGATTEHLVVL